ncbi:MAG: protein O-mannosyl-transferase family [Anaerolineae bacterium]
MRSLLRVMVGVNDSIWTNPRLARRAGLIVILAAALLYLLTLDTGLRFEELGGGDLITHQYAQVEARPSNAPGYPLYTMGGWLWFRVGRALLGRALNPVQILSLYSTGWGLAALAVLYLILLRVTGGRWPVAGLLTAFYAVTYFFWFYSVTTEQYTSAVFQTVLVVWLAFRWEERPTGRRVLWLALVVGTMAANMVTALLIAPPLLAFILARRPDYLRRFDLALKSTLAASLPVLSYAYVYIRGAQHPEWRGAGQWDSAWQWFLDFVSIRQGRDELAPGLAGGSFFTDEFPALIWNELTWVVLIGGLAGIALLGRRRALLLYGTLAVYAAFSWGYRFGNWFQVILPAYPLLVIGFATLVNVLWRASAGGGEGCVQIFWKAQGGIGGTPPTPPGPPKMSDTPEGEAEIGRFAWRLEIGRREGRASRFFRFRDPLRQVALIVLLVGLVGYRFALSLPQANQRFRAGDAGLDRGWAILADGPALPALIAGDYEERLALQYLSTIWGAAPDLVAVGPDALLATPPRDGEPPHRYVTRGGFAASEAVAGAAIWSQAAGLELIKGRSTPRQNLPPYVERLALDVGGGLRLIGLERVGNEAMLPPRVARRLARPNWQVALYWTVLAETEEDFNVSVRPLVDGQLIRVGGEVLLQDHQPVWGIYPTSRWRPGEVVRDVYGLKIPPDLAPQVTAVQVVLYRSVTGDFENVGEVTVQLQSAKTR